MDKAVIDKLTAFFSRYPLVRLRKGDLLIDPNREPSGVFFVEIGLIRRYWIFENGNEITLNMYKPNTFLPMSWAISDVPNTHFYEAMTDTKVRKAPRNDVVRFLKKEPDVVYDLLRRIYIGMEGLWVHIESLVSGQSSTKLTATILLLAKRFGKTLESNNKITISLKIGEKDLANYAGMSRETVSRELQKLKKRRIVSFERGVLSITNSKQLEEMLLT